MTMDLWRTNEILAALPKHFREVPYVGERFPGSPAVAGHPGLALGANCQLFAYNVLEHFGLGPPPVRSSELWLDTSSTTPVDIAAPLDLLLFNDTIDPWGAHIGVWIGRDQILHLSAEAGKPTVWPRQEFASRARYRVLVGIKRVTTKRQETFASRDPAVTRSRRIRGAER